MFVDGADWGTLSRDFWGGRDMTLVFVGGSNRGTFCRAFRGNTLPSPCFHNPSSLNFLFGLFYNFDITKILIIVVSWGRGKKFLVNILCIAIFPVVTPVYSLL